MYYHKINIMNINLNACKVGEIIRLLRMERNISQNVLAEALDIPRPSVSQIENGGRELSFFEFQKILKLFEISFEDFVTYTQSRHKTSGNTVFRKKLINAKIKFDSEKFRQLLLYILEQCGSKPNVGETVLYKLLYFCDFDYFELYEKSLTGMKYKRQQYGPVPSQALFNPVINEMQNDGLIMRISKPYMNNTIQTRYINFMEADLNVFGKDTDKMIKITNEVIARLSHMSARQIEDHVHRDHPWLTHKNNEEIDYGSVFNRTGEFAKRDYEQEFIDSAVLDISEDLPDTSKEEYEYYISLSVKND